MRYRFVTTKEDYTPFAAGHVLHSQGGMTSFPVRLGSEIFQRCLSYLPDDKLITLYDPCCGGGYLLTVLGFLHGERIKCIIASDINPAMTTLAHDNLALLTHDGLAERKAHLASLYAQFGKASHQGAIVSADYLASIASSVPETIVYTGDASLQTLAPQSVDVIMCDVPYGDITAWQGSLHTENPITVLLDAHFSVLKEGGIVTIISDKKQKATHPVFDQVGHETQGKRRIVFLQKR
ncbi:MAG: rRNA methyltransferase [Chloroflexota bacterium]